MGHASAVQALNLYRSIAAAEGAECLQAVIDESDRQYLRRGGKRTDQRGFETGRIGGIDFAALDPARDEFGLMTGRLQLVIQILDDLVGVEVGSIGHQLDGISLRRRPLNPKYDADGDGNQQANAGR